MKILITSGGFVATNLAKQLEQNPEVEKIDVLTDFAKYPALDTDKIKCVDFPTDTYDVIYHTRWNPSQAARPQDHIDNLDYTNLLLKSIKLNPKFIFISSIVAALPTTFYAASKLAGEMLIRRYTDEGKINGVSVRPCAIVGKRKNGLLYDLVQKVKSDEPTLNLMSNSRKPFVHVDQVCGYLAWLACNEPSKSTITLTSDWSMSVGEIADKVMDKLHKRKGIVWGESFSGDTNINGGGSDIDMWSSELAIKLAIEDILEDEGNE